ncbi:MAG: alternative ribosome rescue aminoacyl-tRNA hydrolase ArfB [Actinomycetes bacterium]
MLGPIRIRSVVIPEGEVRWRFSKSSGPGGQSVNTTDSRAEVRFNVATSPSLSPFYKARALARLADRLVAGEIVVVAQEHKSQLRNREAAAARLQEILAAALAPEPHKRRPTKVSKAAVERRLKEKKVRAQVKRNRRPDAD